ncbi:MAG TPA: protein O-GlcNAcase [Gaiellaceae bacterium]|nr:protein O-GlcNAcase [Gaiellaceae bacterium]
MIRGVIEGFYGPPWSRDERLDMIRFCGEVGLTTWVHAPKDDPYHRARWRDPYPEDELARLAEIVAEGARCGVTVAYALAPGLSIRPDDEGELERVVAKCEQVRGAGVRRFQLLWDDLDRATAPSAAQQAAVTNRVKAAVEQDGPLVVCPMGYAGCEDTPYRREFATVLERDVVVYWTGPEVVSLAIAREELDAAVARFGGNELLIWDNYPVNDWDTSLLFLGPLRGRDPRLWEGRCAGLVANAMVQAVPSKLALATVAEYLRDPQVYDPVAAFGRALSRYGAEVVEALDAAPADVAPARDLRELVQRLALGVGAGTAAALLRPFV